MKTVRFGLAIGLALLLTGCYFAPTGRGFERVRPSGNIITEARTVDDFVAIDVRGFGSVELSQGAPQSVTVTGSDNVVAHVTTTVQRRVLVIDTDAQLNVLGEGDAARLTFRITVPDLTALTISGAADIRMESLSGSELALTFSGAGRLLIAQLAVDALDLRLTGLGDVELAGQARQASIAIGGAGSVKAADLRVSAAEMTLSGLGSAELWVTDRLSGRISGAGSVSYYGEPVTDTEVSGLGSWKALGAKAQEM
jgi:hypothetical protein